MIISVDFSYPQYTTEIYLYARQNIILLVFIYKIATPSLIFQAFKEEVLILLLLGNLD